MINTVRFIVIGGFEMEESICIFCGSKSEIKILTNHDILSCNCINCGSYEITEETFQELPYVLDLKYQDKK